MTTKEADSLKPGDKFEAAHGNRWHLCRFISLEKGKHGNRMLKHSWIDSNKQRRTDFNSHRNSFLVKCI